MSRAQVRASIAEVLTNGNLPFVGTVFPARPVILEEEAYAQDMMGQAIALSDNGSGCVLVVNLTDDNRQRKTMTGLGSVDDVNIHMAALELWFASTGGDGIAAQYDYDVIVEAIVVLLRGNPAPANVWSLGEYLFGIKHSQDTPYTPDDGLTVLIAGVIRFEAWEWDTGPAGTV